MQNWLGEILPKPVKSLSPASADASFRRYFRVLTGNESLVVMDAPPEHEPLDQFIAVDQALVRQHLHAPVIHRIDHQQGFLLLEDLGNETYLDFLMDNRPVLYRDAIDALVQIQRGKFDQPDFILPRYDQALLERELDLFEDWYLGRHHQFKLGNDQAAIWQSTKSQLIKNCLLQPQVWVHRDYHSRNLMITPEHSPGIIDFQDMVLGPIGYDLASIFKDCYFHLEREEQLRWLKTYYSETRVELAELDFSMEQLIEWYDYCGLQRHLKVLGIFCRLNYRDQKAQYMQDLPLVKRHLLEALPLYPEFENFMHFFNDLEQQ